MAFTPAAAAADTGGGGGSDEYYDSTCGICMDEGDFLSVRACGHKLCVECAAELLRVHPSDPVPCPFCRGAIRGFGAFQRPG